MRGAVFCGALVALVAVAAPAFGQDSALPERILAGGPVLPSRSVEEAAQVVKAQKGVLYAKYSEALKRDPRLKGTVVVEMAIEPSGQVSQVSIKASEIGDVDFLSAVRSVFLQTRFSQQPVATLVLTYPFLFQPQ